MSQQTQQTVPVVGRDYDTYSCGAMQADLTQGVDGGANFDCSFKGVSVPGLTLEDVRAIRALADALIERVEGGEPAIMYG